MTTQDKRQEVLESAFAYRKAGFEVIPNHPIRKNPLDRGWQRRKYTKEELKHRILIKGWNVGIRNIEGLDIDNKGVPKAQEMFEALLDFLIQELPHLVEKLVIEKTINGGFHIPWRCEVIEGSKKLAFMPPTKEALKKDKKASGETLIETKGEGGQFVVAPSPGYKLIQGDWFNLPVITPKERETIIEFAKTFDKSPPKIIHGPKEYSQSSGGGNRPGDIFNKEGHEEALELLYEHGWTLAYERGDVKYLTRPGKKRRQGISATFNYVAPGVLNNFSSTSQHFDIGGYSPFAIFTYLKYGNEDKDFSEAATVLRKRYGGRCDSEDYKQPRPVSGFSQESVEKLDTTDGNERLRKEMARPTPVEYIPTGYKIFDRATGGLRKGATYAWAAMKKAGKSSHLMKAADHIWRVGGRKIGYLNTELSEQQFMDRLFTIANGLEIGKVERSTDKQERNKYIAQFLDGGCQYACLSGIKNSKGEVVFSYLEKILDDWIEKGVELIIFDNATTLRFTKREDKKEQWNSITDGTFFFLTLMQKHGTTGIIVLHANSSVQTIKPNLKTITLPYVNTREKLNSHVAYVEEPSASSLFGGSQAIGQITGGVVMIHRPFPETLRLRHIAFLKLADFRDGTSLSSIDMNFVGEELSFLELENADSLYLKAQKEKVEDSPIAGSVKNNETQTKTPLEDGGEYKTTASEDIPF